MIRKLLDRLESVDPHSAEIARGAMRGLASRVASVAIVFIFNVVLARILGADQAGLYYLGVAIISMLSVVSLMGMDNGSVRHAANMVADGRWADLGTLYRRSLGIIVVSSVVWATIVFASAGSVATLLFAKPEFAEPLRLMSLALPLLATIWLTSRFLQSAGRAASSLFFQSASIPAVLLMLLALPVAWDTGRIAIGYDLAAALALSLCVFAWYRSVAIAGQKNARFDMRAVLRSSRTLFPANLVNKAIRPWAAVVCLGIWGSAVDVAWYSASIRITALISFAVLPVNTILAPKIAVLAKRNEQATMFRLAARATLMIVAIALPVVSVVILVPGSILGVFGPGFVGAAKLLSVLALGQMINVLTGPVQSLLVMTGNENLHKQASYTGGITILVLSVVLIPAYGAIGAAWANVSAIAVTNLLSAAMVWRLWRRSN